MLWNYTVYPTPDDDLQDLVGVVYNVELHSLCPLDSLQVVVGVVLYTD